MKREIFTKLSAAGFLFVLISAVANNAFGNIMIRFAPGKSEASVNGRIGTARRTCYFVNGKAGQTLKASVSSTSGFVSIFESGELDYEYVLDVPGKTPICVDNLGRSTTFKLTVSIK